MPESSRSISDLVSDTSESINRRVASKRRRKSAWCAQWHEGSGGTSSLAVGYVPRNLRASRTGP
jgi:hypothetical protein